MTARPLTIGSLMAGVAAAALLLNGAFTESWLAFPSYAAGGVLAGVGVARHAPRRRVLGARLDDIALSALVLALPALWSHASAQRTTVCGLIPRPGALSAAASAAAQGRPVTPAVAPCAP